MINEIIKQEKKEVILGSPYMPQTFSDKIQLAGVLCKSGLCPSAMNTPEKVFVALQYGHELGLSPMVSVNNIAVINGKPSLMTDVMAAITFKSGILKEYKVKRIPGTEGAITEVIVTGKRSDNDFEFAGSFSLEQAKKANLLGKDNWKYPEIMLEHRAKSRFFKGIYPELLAGFLTPEEAENLEPIDVTEKHNLKNLIKIDGEPSGKELNSVILDENKIEIQDFEFVKEESEKKLIKKQIDKNQAEDLQKENFPTLDKPEKDSKEYLTQKGRDPETTKKKKTTKKPELFEDNQDNASDAKNDTVDENLSIDDKNYHFDPVQSHTLIFANNRARKIKHLMKKSEVDYFVALTKANAELYDEKQFNVDIEIIKKYELEFINNGGK